MAKDDLIVMVVGAGGTGKQEVIRAMLKVIEESEDGRHKVVVIDSLEQAREAVEISHRGYQADVMELSLKSLPAPARLYGGHRQGKGQRKANRANRWK